eukprot:12175915-Ditylum_brightwellii.AAC.1
MEDPRVMVKWEGVRRSQKFICPAASALTKEQAKSRPIWNFWYKRVSSSHIFQAEHGNCQIQ